MVILSFPPQSLRKENDTELNEETHCLTDLCDKGRCGLIYTALPVSLLVNILFKREPFFFLLFFVVVVQVQFLPMTLWVK